MDRGLTNDNIHTFNSHSSNNLNNYDLLPQNNNNRCKTCLKDCCKYLIILGSYSGIGAIFFNLGYHYKTSEFY